MCEKSSRIGIVSELGWWGIAAVVETFASIEAGARGKGCRGARGRVGTRKIVGDRVNRTRRGNASIAAPIRVLLIAWQ